MATGVVRIVESGEEREYKLGDEDLVEDGKAVWVVAPVFTEEDGRRMDNRPSTIPAKLDKPEPPPAKAPAAKKAEKE